eukprot:14900823-Alexandrium_andersonii.AAC.1
MRKDCASCGLEDCGLVLVSSRFRTPSRLAFVGRSFICANGGAERFPREIRKPNWGPRSARALQAPNAGSD